MSALSIGLARAWSREGRRRSKKKKKTTTTRAGSHPPKHVSPPQAPSSLPHHHHLPRRRPSRPPPRRHSPSSDRSLSLSLSLSLSFYLYLSRIRDELSEWMQGLGNNSGDYKDLSMTLREGYGIPSVVARVSRVDWLRNAAGLLDPNYWRGTPRPRPVLDWYFERVDEAVAEAKKLLTGGGGTISLIGHSAGGWLARVYLEEFGTADISTLLTLGSPHLPPPKGIPGVIDQTRGLLDYVEKNCAPAVYTPELKYICISGRYIQGARLFGNSNGPPHNSISVDKQKKAKFILVNGNTKPHATPSLNARFVGQSYKQVCGQAEVWGDGVVPEVSAHLEGALNISLDGVYHSPVGSDDTRRPWYGSPSVLKKWVHHL